MTDSAHNFGSPTMSVLPPGTQNPNHPCRRDSLAETENATDAMLLLCAAKRIGEAETLLGSMKPGIEAQDATYDALVMAEDLQAHLIGAARAISPETYRDWCRLESGR